MEIPPGSASRSPTWRSRAARTVGSPSATSTPTSSEERPSARRVWEYSGRPRTHRRADEEGTPASAPLWGALPTVGLPVMPRLGVKTTWRVDSHFSPPAIHTGPTAYPQRRQRLTLARAGRSAPHGRHRPGRERPPSPRAWYGRGAECVFTPSAPALQGSLPVQVSLAGRQTPRQSSRPWQTRSPFGRPWRCSGPGRSPARCAGGSWLPQLGRSRYILVRSLAETPAEQSCLLPRSPG